MRALIGLAAATLAALCAAEASARGSGLYDFNLLYGQPAFPPAAQPIPIYPAPPPPATVPPPSAQTAPAPAPAPARDAGAARPAPPALTFTAQGPYVRLDAGYSNSRDAGGDLDKDVEDSYVVGVGVGYRFNPYFRFDTTLSYRGGYDRTLRDRSFSPDLRTTVDVDNVTGLVNLYWDIWHFGWFSPYLMAGGGFAYNDLKDIKLKQGGNIVARIDGDTTFDFAWTAGGGLSFDISQTMTLDLGYRYLDAGEVRSDRDGSVGGFNFRGSRLRGDLEAHEFTVGMRNSF